MYWPYKLWIVPIYYQWIWITLNGLGTQVGAFINDGLNPVKVDLSVWQKRNTRLATGTNEQLQCERPNIYICEEPPNIIPAGLGKTCDYRNTRYHEQVYRWVAGRGCLRFTPDFLYVAGYNNITLSANCIYENWFAPCLEIAKPDGTCGCYPFDPGFVEVTRAIRDSLVSSARGRWERCFHQASDCCSHYMAQETNVTDTEKCETTFDGWTCWHSTEAGYIANEVCSEFAYSNVGPSCHHFSSKECYANGTWEIQTDYSTCSITPRLLRRYRFYIAVLSFSIASCLPAIFVFFFYKRLRVTRVALHRNLLIAIVVRNALVIVSRTVVYIDELTNAGDTAMARHSIACRTLAVAERIAANAVFVCMSVEGVYLHRLIVAVFRQKLKVIWLYGIGAVVAVLPVVIWAVVMGQLNDHSCWVVYTIENIQWALDAPRIAILVVNTALFIDVLRVLLTKIRNSENVNQLNTVKASLFLMPIFGIQFIFTAIRPNTTNCMGEQIYYYISYSIEGLQGFVVAMLFCYVNKEVHSLVKATYKKTENAVVSRVRGSNYPRMSVEPNSDRRLTYSTGIQSQNTEDGKHQYATMKPKLHVAEIISIQASERLADILDPVYETIEHGYCNEGYDCLERSDVDNDSGFIANRQSKVDDYYGFTNVSSVSIGCPDWISSPAGTIYNNSVEGYEIRPFSNNETSIETKEPDIDNNQVPINPEHNNIEEVKKQTNDIDPEKPKGNTTDVDSEYEDCENMFDEIMQYIETNDNKDVVLNPELLSPNRKEEDKIIFVEE
ncbi:uncharacterized protein [Epargyreus clarus]|uniref:uncharacterized protein n=1 Tax=Epargyreus clarus TaxID=520877 RepID=UPI003C2F59A0